ncbi:hypothetical protein AMAG_02864 [Allomyces macrogynus ATCC 38327]|uniref:Uncharacterized protein n=1 Tax=Allomyces macrogynus (strain ATCC 38327) TaxID=578462 RepID=A0A0L0S421_ALLM3|nr:hypothetical protein AMAG_02864 [Allomyces macrogynus ATCC 38327]|eukprot:KNE57114.1 hypothetical protein AMAG_02864 [Allomyces macrogynus ATCC 38327]
MTIPTYLATATPPASTPPTSIQSGTRPGIAMSGTPSALTGSAARPDQEASAPSSFRPGTASFFVSPAKAQVTVKDARYLVEEAFRTCCELIFHFNMGIYYNLDQVAHMGPETYRVKLLDRLHQLDEKIDDLLMDLEDPASAPPPPKPHARTSTPERLGHRLTTANGISGASTPASDAMDGRRRQVVPRPTGRVVAISAAGHAAVS